MFDDWIDVLFRGTFESSLPFLVISHAGTGTLTGSGRVQRDGASIR